MPSQPDTPPPPSFRRRFPLELTPAECDQLEHHARTHGTKRAAILAGLTALAEHSTLTRALAESEHAQSRLKTELAAAQKRAAGVEAQLAQITHEAKSAKTQTAAIKKRESEDRAAAQAVLDQHKRALSQEREQRAELEEDLAYFRERAVDYLHCARCDTWAPPEQWQTKTHQGRTFVHHRACGFHTGGLLGSSILALQDDPE